MLLVGAARKNSLHPRHNDSSSPPFCSSVEILMVNCSNRVLAHLPYMVVADHGRRAVVLAIRCEEAGSEPVTLCFPLCAAAFPPAGVKAHSKLAPLAVVDKLQGHHQHR